MDHPHRHLRKPRSAGWLPAARRLIAGLVIAAGLTLAPPADAQQAVGSTYGPVQRADTLWELALRFRGDATVNAQQAMIAILRANPDAFVEGNINALRTGVTLRVPTAADMAAISPGEASAEFARHEEAWRNRRQTGSAAPGPQAPSPPATPTADAAAPGGGDVSEEIREAREEIAAMRERLDERDEAIEELLVQLAAARRELAAARVAATAPPDESAGLDEEAAGPDAATRASWLPVSPLILGSSLIVLLVLIVVVTLLRQRGEAEDAHREETLAEGEEESHDADDDPGPYDEWDVPDDSHGPADGGGASGRGGESPPGMERRGRAPPQATAAAAAVAVGAGGAVTARELAPEEVGRESGSADLPIGMDLEGDEDWDRAPEDPSRSQTESGDDPGSPPGYRRQIEVGELDDLDLDGTPETGGYPGVPASPGEADEPSTGAGPGRRR